MQMQGLGLEMQARRICYYLCRLYTMEVPAGSEYANLHPAVSIVFTDRILFPNEPKALRTFRFRPTDGVPVDLTDALELRIVEMGKCRDQDDPANDDRLMSWLRFFRYGDSREVSTMLAKKDPAFAQAVDRLTEISQDERERIQAYEREKALLWDAMNRYNKEQQAREIAEAARTEERRIIVQNLLDCGVNAETIATATGLPVEEVERLDQKT
jgi:predicted transposase/invertase (TIGR01784 family)